MRFTVLEDVLRTQCALDPAQPVLAGISGGPDSLCLLEILRTAGYRVIVAHFNHRLRPEAEHECQAVAAHARRLGLPFLTDSADVRQWATEQGLSLEEAARTLRYRFLFASARREGAQAVAVGHTADDQVETVLMHFLRGAGLSGLKGMPYRTLLPLFDPTLPIVRPLLSLWRQDTEAFCREHDLEPQIDPTNADETFFRNRLRHKLIPQLETYNPRFKQALVHTALALQGDHAVLEADLDDMWEALVPAPGEGWIAFNRLLLSVCQPGLQRGLLRRAAQSLNPASRDIGFEALERALAFLASPPGKQADFINGLHLFSEGERLYVAALEADLPFEAWPQVDQPLTLNSSQLDLKNGWVLGLEECSPHAENWKHNSQPWVAFLDADLLGNGELVVRPAHPGERFQPLGMEQGSIKISDLFINLKVPRRSRPAWPLVCAGEQVAWVAGLRIAHPLRVTEKTTHMVKLGLQKN
jgi:tRNA(Ile)-lysidine synthase